MRDENDTDVDATAEPSNAPDLTGKDAIYYRLGQLVKALTGKRVGKSGGRKVFDAVVEEVFAEATREGTIRLNGGFGSFHVRTYGPGTRKLPSGQETTFGDRKKLRYEEGVVVTRLVETEGDFDTVMKERADAAAERAKDKPKPEKEETAAKKTAAKKTAAKKTAAKKTAAKKTTKPAPVKEEEDLEDLEDAIDLD